MKRPTNGEGYKIGAKNFIMNSQQFIALQTLLNQLDVVDRMALLYNQLVYKKEDK